MAWIYLSIAIVLEVIGTSCLKLSNGMSRLWPSIGVFLFYSSSFVMLSIALKKLDVSITYAIWSGVGIIFITLIDVYLFKTHLSFWQIFAIALIVIGAAMLKYLSA